MTEIPFSYVNRDNNILRGIVHVPENIDTSIPKKGINIIVAGIKYRVAPNRLSVKIARTLCDLGWYVIRWDPTGVGESEGDLGNGRREKEIFIDIQKGLYVNDTIEINQYFIDEYGLSEVVMLGNCGGAVTALMAQDKTSTRKLILIDLPIAFSLTELAFEKEALRGGGYSDKLLKNYIKKILNLKSWQRFLSFKSNHKVILGLIIQKIKKSLPLATNAKKPKSHKIIPVYTDTKEEVNKPLFNSFEKFIINEGTALFVCAENDKSTPLLDDYFLPYFGWQETDSNSAIKKITIDKANHIYTDITSQNKLLHEIKQWLS